jgi:hypothetical protein
MMYFVSNNLKFGITGIAGLDFVSLGIPSRRDIMNQYCRSYPNVSFENAWKWSGFYLSLLFFKNAVIVQGVSQRVKSGVASSSAAAHVARLLPTIIETGRKILQEYPPPPPVSGRSCM